jgi:hypothetical protein
MSLGNVESMRVKIEGWGNAKLGLSYAYSQCDEEKIIK